MKARGAIPTNVIQLLNEPSNSTCSTGQCVSLFTAFLRRCQMSIPIKRPASAARLASLIIVCPLLAVPLEKPMLRIISPTSGIVVKPGQKVSFRITGSGIFTALEVVGEAMAGLRSALASRPG